jgi:hypothetical protein
VAHLFHDGLYLKNLLIREMIILKTMLRIIIVVIGA